MTELEDMDKTREALLKSEKNENNPEPDPEKRTFMEETREGAAKAYGTHMFGRMISRRLYDNRLKEIASRFSQVGPNDENQERGNWSNPFEFFLSVLGFAVGLGNVWRFPYLCYRNGGGAFLIPYVIMLFLVGIPVMFLELSLGQYASEGPLTLWKISPLFKGIGISMITLTCVLVIYYNMITAWALYYLVMSLRAWLPWACCEKPWCTERCVSFIVDPTKCPDNPLANGTAPTGKQVFAAEEYFHNQVLHLSDGLHDLGGLNWPMVLALLVAWFIVFGVLMKGIKSFGKTVYFTSTFPYLVLFILLIRSSMAPGASNGVNYYLTPNFTKLREAQVWGDAAAQIFFSTGVCFGGLFTLSSYNTFNHNMFRDAMIVGIANSLTSLLSGFVVFSILGFMAHSQHKEIAEVVSEGAGLTFIAYPQAVTLLNASPVWSAMFFLMLSTLALSSMFPNTENIVTPIIDQFEKLRPYKFWMTMTVCFISFILGLFLCTSGGMYLLQLLDTYGVGYAVLFVGLAEICVLFWCYGSIRVVRNISQMLEPSRISHMIFRITRFYWWGLWTIVTPLILLFAIVFTLVKSKPPSYGDYTFPSWAVGLGWCLTCVSLVPMVVYAVYALVYHMMHDGRGQGVLQALRVLTRPTADWKPALEKYQN